MAGLNTKTGQRNVQRPVNYNPGVKIPNREAQNEFRFQNVGSTGDMVWNSGGGGSPNPAIQALQQMYGPKPQQATTQAQPQMAMPSTLNSVQSVYQAAQADMNRAMDFARENRGFAGGQAEASRQAQTTQTAMQSSARQPSQQSNAISQYNADFLSQYNDAMQGKAYQQKANADAGWMQAQTDAARNQFAGERSGGMYGGTYASGYYEDWSGVSPYGGGKVEVRYDPARDFAKKRTDEQLRLMREQANIDKIAAARQASYNQTQSIAEQNAAIQRQQLQNNAESAQNRDRVLGQIFSSMTGGQGMGMRYW